jgi:hypothetical protein
MDLVTPKAAATHELLFNKPASGAHPKFYYFTNEQGDQIGNFLPIRLLLDALWDVLKR